MKLKPVKKEQVRIACLEEAKPVQGTDYYHRYHGKSKTFKKNKRKGL